MEEILRVVFGYLSGIWRYRWIALLLAAAMAPIGWFVVASLPDVYSSSARVFVDTDSVLKPLIQGLVVQTDDRARVSMMTRILFGRENMEKLARMTDLDLNAKTPAQMDELIEKLRRKVKLQQASPNIYTISYQETTPELCKRVVQSMLTIFVESNLGTAREAQNTAEEFLQREIKDYERRMAEADRKLKDFKLRNLDFVTAKGDYYQRLKDAKDAHKTTQDERDLAQKRLEELRQQLEGLEAENMQIEQQQHQDWLKAATKEATASDDARIEELEIQIDELLLKYTEVHPEVMAMRRTLDRLKAQRDAAREQFIAEQTRSMGTGMVANPVYQEMRLRYSEALAEVASKEAQVENLARRIIDLQRTVDHVLQLENEQKQLSGDHEILKKNHAQLLTRLETARLTRQVDSSADTVRFRILDPPDLPRKPSGPNRVVMSSGVFAAAVAFGVAVALLLSLIRPVFGDRRQINEVLGVPVLGSVNMVWTKKQRRKRRFMNLAFGASFLALVGSFALVLLVFVMDIDVMSHLPI